MSRGEELPECCGEDGWLCVEEEPGSPEELAEAVREIFNAYGIPCAYDIVYYKYGVSPEEVQKYLDP